MQLGVLDEDVVFSADAVVTADRVAARVVPPDAMLDRRQEVRPVRRVAGGENHPRRPVLETPVLLGVGEGQVEAPMGGIEMAAFQLGAGEQVGIHRPLETLGIEPVVDRVDQFEIDALVESFLLAHQLVSGRLGQGVEVVDVVRRGHLEGQLAVLQREEARRAGDPAQGVAVGVDLVEQVEIYLGGALAATDDSDR